MGNQIVFDVYDEVREAMYHPDLSRSLDKRSFDEGNPRAGILSLLHGDEHKMRRRAENPLFQRQALVEYEQQLFPEILTEILARAAVGRADLFELGGALSVVLAARRAGVDHAGDHEQLAELFDYVKVIAQAAAIFDVVGDHDLVQTETIQVLRDFDERYVLPSRRRREGLLDAVDAGETDETSETGKTGKTGGAGRSDEKPPHDLLTIALQRLRAGDETFADHGLLVREAGLFLHGGSHTSAQTLCNAFYFLFGLDGTGTRTGWLGRAAEGLLDAQKCVHETVRLRPPNPELRRLAERDTEVAGTTVPKGTRIVLDVRKANRDPELFGENPEQFDPDRRVRDDVALWGLSFGAGPHICIGRSVAGGLPLTGAAVRERSTRPGHLYGLVALMVQAIAARGVRPDPERTPELDRRTTRGTRWLRFPVVFPGGEAGPDARPGAGQPVVTERLNG
ncbi:MAG: cytochrome P450 [Carbonactinosporaceae bacterium]